MDGVTLLEAAGTKGAAVMDAHVIAGVLEADTFVPLEDTRLNAGNVACIVCSGLSTGGAVEGITFVVRKRFSKLVDWNFDFMEAKSPSKGMLSSKVTWSWTC